MAALFAASYEASPSNIGLLRNHVAGLARECGLDDRTVADVKLAVSEAATNAYVHGYREDGGTIRVEADISDGELRIRVCDKGIGMAPRPDSPGLGLGLPVIASVAQHVEIVRDGPGTEVHMAFPCPCTTARRRA